MGSREMDDLRKRLFLNPVGKVTLAYESREDGSVVAVFKCETCDEILRWQAQQEWWLCPECGYELKPDESVRLLGIMKVALKGLTKDARKKAGRWVWGR